jgi:hypothetical protein
MKIATESAIMDIANRCSLLTLSRVLIEGIICC